MNTTLRKLSTLQKIGIVIGAIFAVLQTIIIVIGVFVAFLVLKPNGTEKFTGAKKDAATKAIDFERRDASVEPLPSFMLQVHANAVRPVTASEKAKYCTNPAYTTNNPNDFRYYAVDLSVHKVFESTTQKFTMYICDILRFDE